MVKNDRTVKSGTVTAETYVVYSRENAHLCSRKFSPLYRGEKESSRIQSSIKVI